MGPEALLAVKRDVWGSAACGYGGPDDRLARQQGTNLFWSAFLQSPQQLKRPDLDCRCWQIPH